MLTGPLNQSLKAQAVSRSWCGWREAYANGDGQAEARRKRIFNADGHLAKDISNHVGPPGRRAIHSPGPLLWHL